MQDNNTREFLIGDLENELGDKLIEHKVQCDQLTITVSREDICKVLLILRDHSSFSFETLIDVTAVDYPDDEERFEVIYNLLSISQNHRLRIKIKVSEETPVPSVSGIYSSAVWYEREVWDMYGIFFSKNPDLRRILTDYGFEGHPLRKDFPLTGYIELRYDEELERVVYDPVELTQDFRTFEFLSPWEGMTDIQLPGDEKAPKKHKPEHGWKSYK